MYLPDIQLHHATTIDDASHLLQEFSPGARILAGGTDLLVDLKTGRLDKVEHVVLLQEVEGLRGVSRDTEGTLRIGSLTTLNELDVSPLLDHPDFRAIREGARQMASYQIRNSATIGGNIASAVPCADLPPILIVLGASVMLHSLTSGERSVPLAELITGPRQTVMRSDEILTSVIIPDPGARFGCVFERFSLRSGNSIAVASVAAGLHLNETETIASAAIALGAAAPIPKLAASASEYLSGKQLTETVLETAGALAAEEADPITDIRASAEYRRYLVSVLTRRALQRAVARAES